MSRTLGQRHLVGAEGALDRHAVDLLRAGPALRRAQHDRRPARPRARRRRARGPRAWIARIVARSTRRASRRSRWWTCARVVALDEVALVAVAVEQRARSRRRVARPSTVGPAILYPFRCRIGSTAPSRAGLRKRTPFHEPSSGAGLGLAVADHAGDEQVGVVEGRAEGVDEHVAELAALVDRAGRRHADVARDAARRGELAEQAAQPGRVLRRPRG